MIRHRCLRCPHNERCRHWRRGSWTSSWLRRKCWARGNDDARNKQGEVGEGAVACGIFQFGISRFSWEYLN
jgi:hypothetical protein